MVIEELLRAWAEKDRGPVRQGAISVSWILEQAEIAARKSGRNFDWRHGVEYWAHLERVGVIVSIGSTGMNYADRPHTFISQKGLEYLADGEASPYNTDAYVNDVKKRVPTPDSVVLAYLVEAVSALQAQLYRASIVMVGCAYEKSIIDLALALSNAAPLQSAVKLAKKLNGDRFPPIAQIYDDVTAAIGELERTNLLGDLADGWERRITSVFEHARGLRNKAGHPTGVEASAREAEAVLLTFPDFYARVDAVTRLTVGLS